MCMNIQDQNRAFYWPLMLTNNSLTHRANMNIQQDENIGSNMYNKLLKIDKKCIEIDSDNLKSIHTQ